MGEALFLLGVRPLFSGSSVRRELCICKKTASFAWAWSVSKSAACDRLCVSSQALLLFLPKRLVSQNLTSKVGTLKPDLPPLNSALRIMGFRTH